VKKRHYVSKPRLLVQSVKKEKHSGSQSHRWKAMHSMLKPTNYQRSSANGSQQPSGKIDDQDLRLCRFIQILIAVCSCKVPKHKNENEYNILPERLLFTFSLRAEPAMFQLSDTLLVFAYRICCSIFTSRYLFILCTSVKIWHLENVDFK